MARNDHRFAQKNPHRDSCTNGQPIGEDITMKIRLDLADHCIETEIKRRHETAMSRYFKRGKDKDAIEVELILLENALNAFDFDRLRGRWAVLSGLTFRTQMD
jgi:hypothetical protein